MCQEQLLTMRNRLSFSHTPTEASPCKFFICVNVSFVSKYNSTFSDGNKNNYYIFLTMADIHHFLLLMS